MFGKPARYRFEPRREHNAEGNGERAEEMHPDPAADPRSDEAVDLVDGRVDLDDRVDCRVVVLSDVLDGHAAVKAERASC